MRIVILLLSLSLACSREPQASAPTDTREPVDIKSVIGGQLPVHERADDASPVLVSFENGESVPILSRQGEWVEVRIGDRTGWAHAADLGTRDQAQAQQDDPTPRFRKFPSPVSSPSSHGEIYLEADVNTDGDVVAVRIIGNTTGSDALAAQNAAALQAAKFLPIVKNGGRQPFKYYHRVGY